MVAELVIPHASSDPVSIRNIPTLTTEGLSVHHIRECADCGTNIYLHGLLERFNSSTGGWYCDSCKPNSPYQCLGCDIITTYSNICEGGRYYFWCTSCFPTARETIASWEAEGC